MCVDGFNVDVLVRVHVCLFIFLHFIFRVFCFVLFCFFEICVSDFLVNFIMI